MPSFALFRRTATLIATLLSIGVLALAGYRLSPLLDSPTAHTLPLTACDPTQRDCTVDIPGVGQIALSLQPKPIQPLKSFRLIVTIISGADTNRSDVDSVEVDFDGTTMKMGNIRQPLARVNNIFSGDAMLPICITGTMEWTATVWLSTSRQRVAIPFHFVVAGR